MNKLVIAVFAGYFLGNDKARHELSKTLKLATGKTIDIFNNLKSEVGENVHETDQLHTSPAQLPQNDAQQQ